MRTCCYPSHTAPISLHCLSLRQGLSSLALGASALTKKVNEAVIKPTLESVQDPNFTYNVKEYLSSVTEKVTETTKKSYGYVSQQIQASLVEGQSGSASRSRSESPRDPFVESGTV